MKVPIQIGADHLLPGANQYGPHDGPTGKKKQFLSGSGTPSIMDVAKKSHRADGRRCEFRGGRQTQLKHWLAVASQIVERFQARRVGRRRRRVSPPVSRRFPRKHCLADQWPTQRRVQAQRQRPARPSQKSPVGSQLGSLLSGLFEFGRCRL